MATQAVLNLLSDSGCAQLGHAENETLSTQNLLLAELHRLKQHRRQPGRQVTQSSPTSVIASSPDSLNSTLKAAATPSTTCRAPIDDEVHARLVEAGFPHEQVLAAADRMSPLDQTFGTLLEALLADNAGAASSADDSYESQDARLEGLLADAEHLVHGDPDAFQEDATDTATSVVPSVRDGNVHMMIESQLIAMGFTREQVHEVLQHADAGVDTESLVNALLQVAPPEQPSDAPSEILASSPAGLPDALPLQTLANSGSYPASPEPPPPPMLNRELSVPSQGILSGLVAQHGEGRRRSAVRALLALNIATRQGIISPGDRLALHSDLVQGQLDLVSDIVNGLGIREAPYMPLADGQAEGECIVCFTLQDTLGWACPDQHRFCADCIRQHVESVTFPRCPQIGCAYDLEEEDFIFLEVGSERLESFRHAKLQGALDSCGENEETSMRCPKPECGNVVIIPAGQRMRFHCDCGVDPFCTMCLQSPYHYHVECGRVQPLREKWLAWIKAEEALQASVRAHEQLLADEKWKADNCRLCPHCQRPISKVEGCESMVCGRAYHGGDQQPGCGKSFMWPAAKKYEAKLTRRRVVHESHEAVRKRASKSFHPFATCSICGTSGLRGLCFRCIHCESFNCCSECEAGLADAHPSEHVFDVMVETGIQWNYLPAGTRVRLVRFEDRLPQSWLRDRAPGQAKAKAKAKPFGSASAAICLEGKFGSVVRRWAGPPHGYCVRVEGMAALQNLPSEHVEPVVTSQAEARRLSKNSEAEEKKDNPHPALVPVPRPPPTPLIATSKASAGAAPLRGRGRGLGSVYRANPRISAEARAGRS